MLDAFALTDVGAQREHNEDYMLSDADLGLFVVSDGMGGHNAGEVASKMTTEIIKRVVASQQQVIQAVESGAQPATKLQLVMRQAVEAACAEVHDAGKADPSKYGMGCTCTAVIVAGNKACLGQVGDSRLYLLRSGTMTQLSEDHTFVAEAIKAGVFSPEEAAECGYKNVLTRAIGKDRNVMVDTLAFDFVPGDVLLLCSDGLHNYFKDPAEFAKYLEGEGASSAPARLIGLANQRGGSDNITAIVLRAGIPRDNETARRGSEAAKSLETLRKIELLTDLTMAELVRFKQIFVETTYAPGAIVVRENEVNDNLFVIVSGSAEVLRGDLRIAVLPAGANFGEMSLLNNRPRTATVRALEPSRMLMVSRERLYWFLQQDGMLAAKFFWKLATTLSKRLEDMIQQQQQQAAAAAAAAAQQSQGWYSGVYARPSNLG